MSHPVRWLIRRDMPDVMEIENASFEFAWSEDDFIRCLRQRNAIDIVAEIGESVVGFAVYRLHKQCVEVANLAVSPDRRRKGVDSALIEHITRKQGQRRDWIKLRVRESSLTAQQWLRAVGFRATRVDRGYYDDGQDAYRFERRISRWQCSVPVSAGDVAAVYHGDEQQ